ncbi:MAG: EamA family transporter [Chloroflexota bacterium]
MELGLAMGLLAALAWGISSYLGAIAARQFGGWVVNIGAALFSLAVLLPMAPFALANRPAAPTTGDIVLLGVIGVALLGADLVMYTLLTMAPVAVIYPIVASYSAVVTVLAVVVLGETLSLLQVAGVVLVTSGIFLIAWRRSTTHDHRHAHATATAPAVRPAAPTEEAFTGSALRAGPRRSSGPAPHQASPSVIGIAILLTIGVGVLWFLIADVTRRLGWYQPVFIDRIFQSIAIVALLGAGHPPRRDLRGHPGRWWGVLVAIGALNAIAACVYGIGNQFGSTALTATATSTFAAVPVVLGIVLLGERPQRHQLVGITAAIVGIVALGA